MQREVAEQQMDRATTTGSNEQLDPVVVAHFLAAFVARWKMRSPMCVCPWMSMCLWVCMRGVCVVRACVRAIVHARVWVCLREWVRACIRVRAVFVFESISLVLVTSVKKKCTFFSNTADRWSGDWCLHLASTRVSMRYIYIYIYIVSWVGWCKWAAWVAWVAWVALII